MDITQEDHRKLMSAILRQTIDDYIKMQHPRYRQRKYEREAFWSARDLLWDNEYALDIQDAEGLNMNLSSLCEAAADRDNVSIKSLRKYLIQQSQEYWEEKPVKTLEIPEDVVIEGHAYQVRQADTTEIDFENKIISMDKLSPIAEEEFMRAMVDLTCHHGEIKTSGKARKELGKALYRLLRINSCFTGEF